MKLFEINLRRKFSDKDCAKYLRTVAFYLKKGEPIPEQLSEDLAEALEKAAKQLDHKMRRTAGNNLINSLGFRSSRGENYYGNNQVARFFDYPFIPNRNMTKEEILELKKLYKKTFKLGDRTRRRDHKDFLELKKRCFHKALRVTEFADRLGESLEGSKGYHLILGEELASILYPTIALRDLTDEQISIIASEIADKPNPFE